MADNITLEQAENEVIDTFSMYEEWLDKYEYLIDLGKNLEPYPEDKKTDDRLIKGCQSRVWLDCRMEEGFTSMPTAMPSSPRESYLC